MDPKQIELIRRIASVVGHEMRNPLAVIKNSSYFVKTKLSQTSIDPKIEKHLGIIESEITRADALISDILAYSRPLELKPAPASLTALAKAALAELSAPADIKVKTSFPKNAPSVSVDAAAVQNALRRILDNAVEAMNGQGTLTLSVSAAKGWARLEVRDTGTGIKPEALGSVFEPFYTTKPRGLGLGLAIARKAVEAHKGKMEAANHPDGGAAVALSLPA